MYVDYEGKFYPVVRYKPSRAGRLWRIIIITALLIVGCEVWREAYFKVTVKNSTFETFEVYFNESLHDPVLNPGDIVAYRPRTIARGAGYTTGPSRRPECTRIHVSLRNVATEEFENTLSFQMCQDQEVMVEITPTRIILLNQTGNKTSTLEF